MADEPEPTTTPTLDPEIYLPFDEDAAEGEALPRGVGVDEFLYIGRALTAGEWTEYVRDYDFGTIPPDFVILHHTAVPSATWARFPQGDVWDSGEAGLGDEQIKQKRLGKLTNIKEFYRTGHGWDRGPHLFVDDRYIWLFTPMRETGIHAKQGNSYRDGNGLHYSIGIEVVGYYENVRWSEPVAKMVGHCVAVLHNRLKTFELRHQRNAGGISSHRDYNKPTCPGKAITEQFYIEVIKRAAESSDTATVHTTGRKQPAQAGRTLTPESPVLGPASAGPEAVVAYIKKQLPPNSEYKNDVATIIGYYWKYAPSVGVDPFLAAVQCVHETDALRSYWAGRPRRNPANLGVRSNEIGLSFATWEAGVQAHLGQLLAFALTDAAANEQQRAMMAANPGHALIAGSARGTARTVRDLNNRWSDDVQYADKIVARAKAILEG